MHSAIKPNVARHNAEDGTTIVTVFRRNGKSYDVILDTWVYCLFPEITLHMKAVRHGRDEYYAATYFEGGLKYLHQLVGEAYLKAAAAQPGNDRRTIDHKNRQHLDCRIANLRAANHSEQNLNRKPRHKAS